MIVASYYILGGALFGALLGAGFARRRGGRGADLLHWAAVLGIVFGLIGLYASIIIARSIAG